MMKYLEISLRILDNLNKCLSRNGVQFSEGFAFNDTIAIESSKKTSLSK